jgi:hypothetical protein
MVNRIVLARIQYTIQQVAATQLYFDPNINV